ncbi:hypothetical protein LCGC14_0344840 [marine sediment metagenome]|uniref:Uncharacterized protein n=1 Tax=marine sediment metagenome TaxID=412755 RepID=A0A0F9WKJ2_9ZZZZ
MGYLEDFLAGMDWSGYDDEYELPLNRYQRILREKGEDILSRPPPLQQFSADIQQALSYAQDPQAASIAGAGLVSQPEPQAGVVAEAASGRERLQQAAAGAKEAEEQQKAALLGEANQSSLDAMLDMPQDALVRIRAQARAKGRAGSLGAGVEPTGEDYAMASFGKRGGGFSQGELTPEIAARGAETAEWLGGQTERDMAFAASPEQARRDPQYAATAAESLTGLRSQRTQDRQVATMEQRTSNQEALINSLTESGGKIPFETAMKLDVAGFRVPAFAIGMSKDHAKRQISQLQQDTMKSIQDVELSGAPESVTAYLYYILAALPEYAKRIEGEEDIDRIMAEINEMIQRHGEQSGARQFAEYRKTAMVNATQAGQ